MKHYKSETNLIHAGCECAETTQIRGDPSYQITSYQTKDMSTATSILEQRMSVFDGGVGALAFANGQAAILATILSVASAGDEVISLDGLCNRTHYLFKHTLKQFGIKVHFADSSNISSVSALLTPQTKAIYAETIGRLKLNVTDIVALGEIAHRAHLPLIIDNTLMPFVCQPLKLGADIVVYSATEFLGGHGNSSAGLVIDSGQFDWMYQENGEYKFPLIVASKNCSELDSVGLLVDSAFIMKAKATLLRDFGVCLSPFNALLILQGLETLHLRMERHIENARKVVAFLKNHPKTQRVVYPGLHSSQEDILAQENFKIGAGSIVGFELKGDIGNGKKFMECLSLFSCSMNVGCVKSSVCSVDTMYTELTNEQKEQIGITKNFVYLSIGIEHIEDIVDAIDSALRDI
ncbi:hypothetical protein CCZ01_00605 [Helicobacter monodelphidis]|uniref:PLP-dependent transferase n=1 Tax=Helicobacter sp. 15-1451 TaxID=2004995 RepID=UPI000DCB34B9|nr:PLP-dependent transferase [Helicobacter sp. 15-1451]RAX59272.1 hypothetical protein CCZ01_00605 [Helicobacter sp. 15-1451]